MLDIHRTDAGPTTKIYFSHSVLPSYIDPLNVTTKKQPFVAFNKQHFTHSLHLILPADLWESVQLVLQNSPATSEPQYARVHMALSEILEPEFLSNYIKTGNIMMLSEGRALIDNCFSLYQGKLHMELDRQTYERCGLQGTPIEDGGKKHQKQRWSVDVDLTSPSMKHGKKGFGRLVWACKNVLDFSLTWLFCNFNEGSNEAIAEGKEEICKHAPWIHNFSPAVHKMEDIVVPRLRVADLPSLYGEDEALELLEYIHMLNLGSPRVNREDAIDPHLCRYETPSFGSESGTADIVKVSWKGFIAAEFVREIFLAVRERGFKGKGKARSERNEGSDRMETSEQGFRDGESLEDQQVERAREKDEKWFAMSAQAFGGKNGWTLMQFASRDVLVWETES